MTVIGQERCNQIEVYFGMFVCGTAEKLKWLNSDV